ncbi:MAG: transcription termination/antitermination protein NusA [Rhodospirillaceae bacterium]|jgi:transcription termination/antitermination protein NusA|nr:transcription termination/antitermination protein NusA [Rhodospirillaceae bacterium]MBT6404747.1 transcription termination/antitermination protein NusA [Rhodospirillaceae bacterium]MBT6537310.1 transcription termination/antitermination protein NusA [Rhodospirillaceae bacterium]MBT7362466.1 transcription termination/antitermination protein NusA [Rhodospirillaceae bacterium]
MESGGPSRIEMLAVADAVAREKGIEREEVITAMEQAIQKAGRNKYGPEHDIRAIIDRDGGHISLARHREVVEEVEDENTQLTVEQAQAEKADAKVGDFLIDELPPIDFGRIAAQTAKQVIVQRVRDAERERQYEEYKDRVGEVVNGLVKRVEYGNVTVDLGRAEGVMRRDEALPRENHRPGDRIRGYIYDVRREPRGPQIFVTRTRPELMKALFAQEVPEIYDGIIEIRAAARDPGSRAKIAVISRDASIDPVGACVGMRGSRVQAVVGELQGEKIDIIPWSDDPATFVVNALAPAEVTKVVLDEDANKIEVVVPDEQLSLAIGRRGQNVRLASMLSGWDIDILTEEEESQRRQDEFNTRSALFIEAFDVEDVIAHLLVTEGFATIEEVAFVPMEDLTTIEGFDDDIGAELQARARNWLEERDAKLDVERKKLGVEDAMLNVGGVTLEKSVRLGTHGVRTVEDLAGLMPDEYRFIFMDTETEVKLDDLFNMADHEISRLVRPSPVQADEANGIIMAARVAVYGEDVIPPEPEPDPEAEEAEEKVPEATSDLATAEAVFAPAPDQPAGE